MSQLLKVSTAADVILGPFVDSTDGVTAETALTISQADIRLSKNGAAFAQTNNATGATHRENGHYLIPLDTTDTNTVGRLRVAVNESGALPVWLDFMVVPAMVYDSLVAGTDVLQADVTQLLGTAWLTPGTAGTPDVNVKLISGDSAAADNAEAFFDGTGYAGTGNVIPTVTTVTTATNVTTVNGLAAGVITAASIAADAITAAKIADGAIDTATFATGCTIPRVTLCDTTATNTDMITAAGIRTAVGLASANLDTQIATLATASALSSLVTTVGAAGAGLTALAPASTALSTANWTTARAGYLDALNGGIVVKRNTALANFEFLMVLSSDHATAATGKTITATRSIDGGAFVSCTNSASEVSSGIYKISLSAADLNGTTVTLRFTATACDDTFITILTQP